MNCLMKHKMHVQCLVDENNRGWWNKMALWCGTTDRKE